MARERDVVMVPCWRRPEFLWHCLDNLARAEGSGNLHVLFRTDTGYDRAILEVIAEFASRFGSHQVEEPVACPYRRARRSANVLGGYLQAASITRRYVFVIEEDVMPSRDFLRWHYAVHASQPRLFCSNGLRNLYRAVPAIEDPTVYYLSSGDYSGRGVCFESSVIANLVAPHVSRAYFSAPEGYCARNFPASRVAKNLTGEDDLIRRIQEAHAEARSMAFPYRARGFHAGRFGYRRPESRSQGVRERIQHTGRIIHDVAAMRAASERREYLEDSMPVPLEMPAWSALRFQALTGSPDAAL